MQLRVTYDRVEEFLDDYDKQIAHGGILVRGEIPSGLERGHTVELEVVTPVGGTRLYGQVIQVLAGAGVAVTVAPEQLSALARAARSKGAHRGAASGHAGSGYGTVQAGNGHAGSGHAGSGHGAHAASGHAASGHAAEPSQGAATAKKIQLALHGDKSQRAALLRDPNKMIHAYVLRNPQIQLDEVVTVARMTTVAVDVLTFIASRREWAERSEIALALVRNPKTPVPLAVRLLDHVSPSELRQLAKQANVREPIARAARKKVIG